MNPMPGTKKQMNSDDRDKAQDCAQAPETRPLFKDHGGNALIKFQRLVRITPYLHRADGHEQAGSSDLQLRVESMPHDTLGQNTLQSTEHTTHAKPRLPCNHVPIIMPAKDGMGQQQLSHEKGNMHKKIRQDFLARGGKQQQLRQCSKRKTPQQAP
jgi:hypothetical protein